MRRATAALLLSLSALLSAPALADAFPRPAALEPAIAFWTKVYSEVSSQAGLLHDRRNLDVVYETVELAEGMNRPQRRAHVRERRAHYEAILRTLAGGKRDNLTAEERRVLDLFPANVDSDTLRNAAGEIRFQLGQADRFRRGLMRAGAWEPHIRRTLEEMGLPQEIAVLPQVESSFNPDAYSRVGAAGIWQFTRATGRRFMRVDHIVDERMDPFKATVAAARLLQHNYSVTNDWALALTAYNHGLAGIRRAARSVGSDNIADIIHEHHGRNWGFASRNFYPAFLAAVDVDAAAHEHFGPLERHPTIVSETVELPFYVAVDDVIAAFEVDRSTLRELNRGLRPPVWNGEKLIPHGYSLRVPAGPERPSAAEMLARIDPDNRYRAQIPDRHHTVARGESLSMIAGRYGVSTRELVSLNNLHSANLIRVGQRLRLPVAESGPISGETYIVERGDSLSLIAQRAGTTVGRLAQANDIDPSRPIQPGQELRVDGHVATEAATGPGEQLATANDSAAETATAAPESESDAEAGAGAGTEPEPARAPAADEETLAEADTDAAGTQDPAADPLEMTTTDQALPAPAPAEIPPQTLATLEREGSAQPQFEPEDDLTADPSDYSVANDATIEVQAAETLGHYAEWLDMRASGLRRINNMSYGTPVVIGHRLKLEFRRVNPATFEQRRREYHEELQARFFDRFRITGTEEQEIQRGDSLWTLARRHDYVPVWLLRQYNPDLDFERLHPGMPVMLPTVERQPGPDGEPEAGLTGGEG